MNDPAPPPPPPMDAARWRWQRAQELFHAALEQPAPDRRGFLDNACDGDAELLATVLALLEEDARGEVMLDRDLATIARDLLDPPAAGAALPGQFGPYRIQSVLGEGGMGVVYLATRDDLGGKVAIKVLRDGWLSPARRRRFASEQRTLARLDHPSIARLYDADVLADGTPWFAMEYVEGLSLTAHCRRHAASLAERLRLLHQVCDAVLHAHRHLIVHRDLKPSNVLVRPDGAVKLLDFGIAKQLTGDAPAADQTRTGLRLMTPAYAAPEQLRGERVGIHTDVYALGVMLYELLTERLPFDVTGLTPAEAEMLILAHDPVRPSALARVTATHSDARAVGRASWADLDVLCLTAMHKDPARRYRTVEALMRDIEHYLDGEPLEARADTLRYRFGKFVRRNRQRVAALAVVAALVVGLVVFYTVRLAGARNAALAEAARAQRIQRFMLNLFRGGDEAAGPAESLRVVTLVGRGMQDARGLDAEPVVQAELYATLGTIYQQLGDLGRADSLLQLALEQRRALGGPGDPDMAASLVALGVLRADQARFAEAEQLVRDGLASSERALPPGHPAVLRARAALGRVLQGRGAYAEAIAVQEATIQLQAAGGAASRELADNLRDLAGTHFYAGHYATADSLNRRVLAMSRALYGERHPFVAEDLINLGATQFERGEYVEAERYYREALDISTAWYGADHPKTAAQLTMLGRALVFQGRRAEAAGLLGRALVIRERVYGPAHPEVASTLNEVGTIALAEQRYADAEAAYRRMEEIYRSVFGGQHYLIGTALSNRASVYSAQRQYARAEPLYREAVRIYRATLPAEHTALAIGRIKLGRVLLRQGRFTEAEAETRAGYEVLKGQASGSSSFLRAAQEDLAAIYDSLHRPPGRPTTRALRGAPTE